MKRVLITGASGFIGRHCLWPLQSAGYEIHAVSVARSLAEEYPYVNWHQANLLDANKIHALVTQINPTHLLHLAWDVTPGKYWTSPHNLQWVQAGLELLQAFEANGGRRVVMAGTCAEYDWRYGYCSEMVTPLFPKTLYGVCKHSLQTITHSFADLTGLSLAWGRIFFLYGPYEHPNRLVSSVIQSVLKGEPARCSHGKQVRDLLYVADVANAFVALLDSEVTGAINIASGIPVMLRDVIYKIAEIQSCPELILLGALPTQENEPPLLVADVNRLQYELNWQPQYDLSEGLAHTVQWWQQQPGK